MAQQARRLTKTSNLKNLFLNEPNRVKIFRKNIDRQSGKPLHKTAKFDITLVTDHAYVSDKRRVYRKNHICLKPNLRYDISVGQNTLVIVFLPRPLLAPLKEQQPGLNQ